MSPPSELQEIPVAIREQSGVLCFFKHFLVHNVILEYCFAVCYTLKSFEEEGSYHRDLVKLFDRNSAAEKLAYRKESIISEIRHVLNYFFGSHIIELRHMEVANSDLKRTYRFEKTFFKV